MQNSGHLRLCQQPRAAHALRSDQFISQDSYQAVVLQTNPRSLRSVQNTDESQHKNVREKSDKSLTPILRPAANANVKTQQPIPAVITSGQAGSDEKQKLVN